MQQAREPRLAAQRIQHRVIACVDQPSVTDRTRLLQRDDGGLRIAHLCKDLGLDWRQGGDLFEHLLLDYDVASNWGNWVAAAGATGGRINHFNITKQSKDYDPQGDYIRHWLPELAAVPTARIHEPWCAAL